MRSAEVSDLLRTLAVDLYGVPVEMGLRGDAAWLRLHASDGSGRWAAVGSPGDRWFSLDVDGGFSVTHFEEDTPDGDVVAMLTRYVGAARFYVVHGGVLERRALLRSQVLRVDEAGREVALRRSVAEGVRARLRARLPS